MTSLGGSPSSKNWFFQVWDNACKKYEEIIKSATAWGYTPFERGEKREKDYFHLEYYNSKTGSTIELEVFTRDFED